MSIKVMSAVWEHSRQKGGRLLLLLALADYANDEGECWPAVPTLAQKARMSERNAHYALAQMAAEDNPEVVIEPTPGRSNRYTVRPGGAILAGVQSLQGAKSRKKGCNRLQGGVQPVAPESVIEPSVEPSLQESTNSDSLDAAPPGADIRSYLQTFGLQGNALDNLCYKATMDGVGPAHIAALLDAARADFAARRVAFNAVAFLSVYPYRGGWTYQPPAPKRPAPAQSYSPPPPDFVTHQEVVTSRPLAEPPVFERSTKTREERAEMRRRAFIEQREKASHGRITAA